MKVVDSARMAEIDRAARERYRIPQAILMEDAGLRAWQLAKQRLWRGEPPAGRVVFLAGKGNNGGDALVMARQCRQEGLQELTIVLGAGDPPAGSLASDHLAICDSMGIEVVRFPGEADLAKKRLREALWIVDGLLGTGLSGAAKPPLTELIALANSSPAEIAAIDIPSGVGDAFRAGFSAIEADLTLTVGLPKLCLYLPQARRYCGEILVVPGVFPQGLLEAPDIPGEMIDDRDLDTLKPLARDAHKGRRGHLAVFAGSEGTTGAAWLASTAAARSRAGLVTLFLERALYAAALPRFKSVMIRPLEEGADPQRFDARRFDALLIGPGWGLTEERRRWLERLLALPLPGVLDADGISLLAELNRRGGVRLGGRWVLSPHPGEFARLIGADIQAVLEDPLPKLKEASASLDAVIVLKGHCTYVVAPTGRYWILDGMNPAMGTGGSGDVLAGIMAGLAAGGLPVLEAARLGVLLHSRIGRLAYRDKGYFLAEDLLPYISLLVKDRPCRKKEPMSPSRPG